ncbi:MAG: prepilin-type N-terminal cleavage/methylation domain-containing protein [Candidatus Abyssobacteria bacterium SURF_17]|uniref:Prepilin-type N-terminal cleavage/methylation domain-containing protein n=1 Tax=Candidatus Abyssobacteria bacterium SURF_17 TaxID=2093361 RepID=A0A419F253_9BACT|nr:MAG: prepilin-type N-terminal cleavage/methylation domain-containing protein [Candidatus Abyssubacteria bacterium SURF_17]
MRERRANMPRALKDMRGFTLTELLVVVAIIVLLTSIVVPNLAGRLTLARMHAAEDQIAELETALAAYHADFGTYPGDVFPTEDKNNNGVLDQGEDIGVDIDGNGDIDYAKATGTPPVGNNRLDRGDGVVNIDDLEWALRTTAKNGPYLDSIPLDPWGNRFVYYAPLTRPTNTADYLYIAPETMRREDGLIGGTPNGRLDGNKKPRDGIDTVAEGTEDAGIGLYSTTADASELGDNFTTKYAGADNGILDHGDDDNKDGTIQTYYPVQASPAPQQEQALEFGNADMSPDGLTRNLGYYIYCVGRNEIDETATGYEDIGSLNGDGKSDSYLNKDYTATGGTDDRLYTFRPGGSLAQFSEDINTDTTLDTGYEDTGNDGIPGTKDFSEDDGELGANEDFLGSASGSYNANDRFDIGGDDINSWNKKKPWRDHSSYGG